MSDRTKEWAPDERLQAASEGRELILPGRPDCPTCHGDPVPAPNAPSPKTVNACRTEEIPMARDSDVIEAYWGEFLVSCFPLEASINYCSHGCAYCFANLNSPDRRGDIEAATRMITGFHTRTSPAAMLLKAGYPLLVSNRVDPFSTSNERQAIPLMELATEMGVPLAIQTKGGRHVDQALAFMRPASWYISLSFDDDAKRARVEPGAPSVDDRLRLIEKLRAQGHTVVLGLNPAVPEWCDNFDALVQRAVDAGAEGVWAEPLHLSTQQQGRMNEREKAAVSLPVLDRMRMRGRQPADEAAWSAVKDAATRRGLPFFYVGQWEPSRFWEVMRRPYEKTFPVLQDAINACHAGLEDGDLLTFDEFAAPFLSRLPDWEECNFRHYIAAKDQQFAKRNHLPPMGYRGVLELLWSSERMGPVANQAFSWAGEDNGDGTWDQLTDDEGRPILVFCKEGTTELFREIPGEADAAAE